MQQKFISGTHYFFKIDFPALVDALADALVDGLAYA
jgi:hypothetical protein